MGLPGRLCEETYPRRRRVTVEQPGGRKSQDFGGKGPNRYAQSNALETRPDGRERPGGGGEGPSGTEWWEPSFAYTSARQKPRSSILTGGRRPPISRPGCRASAAVTGSRARPETRAAGSRPRWLDIELAGRAARAVARVPCRRRRAAVPVPSAGRVDGWRRRAACRDDRDGSLLCSWGGVVNEKAVVVRCALPIGAAARGSLHGLTRIRAPGWIGRHAR